MEVLLQNTILAMMHDGMMGGMTLTWILAVIFLVLGIAALAKYLKT